PALLQMLGNRDLKKAIQPCQDSVDRSPVLHIDKWIARLVENLSSDHHIRLAEPHNAVAGGYRVRDGLDNDGLVVRIQVLLLSMEGAWGPAVGGDLGFADFRHQAKDASIRDEIRFIRSPAQTGAGLID